VAKVTQAMLTPQEKVFLDAFLHEATTSPFFNGPASKALFALGVGYQDISYLAWAYDQEVPRATFGWGHAAEVAPPLPWPDREAALRRNLVIQRLWEQKRRPLGRESVPSIEGGGVDKKVRDSIKPNFCTGE
jgi:hypothetical protein